MCPQKIVEHKFNLKDERRDQIVGPRRDLQWNPFILIFIHSANIGSTSTLCNILSEMSRIQYWIRESNSFLHLEDLTTEWSNSGDENHKYQNTWLGWQELVKMPLHLGISNLQWAPRELDATERVKGNKSSVPQYQMSDLCQVRKMGKAGDRETNHFDLIHLNI